MAVIEITTFDLVADADEAAFLVEDERVQTAFIPHRAGIIRRTTARAASGRWLVQAWWATDEDAAAAAAAADASPITAGFRALVDRASTSTERFTTLD